MDPLPSPNGPPQRGVLAGALDLPNGIPGKDVFRRVLMALQPAAFQACFASWLGSLRTAAAATTGVTQPVLAVDGKTLRRSHDRGKGLGALHSVSVWASEFGLSLGQVACDEKSNEITAIPELLRLVDIKGAIITIDAMGTQKAIAAQIVDGGADYVLALKGNQETLHQEVIDYIDEQQRRTFVGVTVRRHQTEEKGHGREERRSYLHMEVSEGPVGDPAVDGVEVDRHGDLGMRARRERDDGDALLHQQPPRGREAIRARGSQPLGHRKRLPLVPGHDVPRGRIADPRAELAGELRVAESVHVIAVEAASWPRQHRHEAAQLRLERRLLTESHWWDNDLVAAGPGALHYEGRPAVGCKPLEIQTRDELLAYIRRMQANHREGLLDMVGADEDLDQLIRVCLTNPGDIRGFIEANYPKEYAAMGDASTRKDEGPPTPVGLPASSPTTPAFSEITDDKGRPMTYWGGLAAENQREIRLLTADEIEAKLLQNSRYLHEPLTGNEKKLIRDVLLLCRTPEPVAAGDMPYDELKEHCLKAQDAAIERGDQLFHARQRIYELEAQIRSTMPVVVDLVAGANPIEGVPSTHLMQQWKIEQAKACAEAWVLKWK